MRRNSPRKPGYSLTRQAFWASFILAWAVIMMIIVAALLGVPSVGDLAPVTIPSMVTLIAALLGIHRFAGSLDYRASASEYDGAAE